MKGKHTPTPATEATDEALMVRIGQRDKAAFDVLYARHHQRLFRYLYRMCWQNGPLAEDLLQEVFLRVFRSAAGFDAQRSFVTWMFSVAYNLVKNEYRRQAVRGPAIAVEEHQAWELPELGLSHDQSQWQQALQQAVALLPEGHATVFWLRHEQHLEVKVIAEILEIPVGTVKSRLYHVHRQLAQQLSAFKNLLHSS